MPSVSSSTAAVPSSPVCNLSQRLSDFENIQCLAPKSGLLFGRQFYNVICNENGQWSRVTRGPADYSQCPNTCVRNAPSDVENVFCPGSNSSVKNGLQRFTVTCLKEGSWSRTISGAADYSACPAVCNASKSPSLTSAVACTGSNANLLSGIQNYTLSCLASGEWSRIAIGGVDYSRCPQSCDQNKKPPLVANEKCPATVDVLAVRSYSVICNTNGTWSKTPTALDSSLCPAPTCDATKKPASQDLAACPAPNQTRVLSKQNFSVSCSGTSWVRTATTRDDSQCPKSCGAQPPDDFNLVACQGPFQSTQKAKQSYNYTCNSTTGQYVRNIFGAVDYNSCPKSCAGANPASTRVMSCPAGFSGTAYQNYSSTCDTAAGQWTTPLATVLDNSGCSPTVCSGASPTNFDPVACPAPFQSRQDAKRMYTASQCVSGAWVRGLPTGIVDSSSCPVNDCSGSANPGTEKDIMACSGDASGRIFQTCSLSCSGNTYTQTNCSANNYSRCDCGANSTYSIVTRSCVQNLPAKPTFSCNQSEYQCGQSVICSATSFDGNLQGCDANGCNPLVGSAGWSYSGNGQYQYSGVNQNSSVSDAAKQWRTRNTGGDSATSYINMKACTVPTCSNGATNYPGCNSCSSGSKMLGGSCQTCNSGNALAWYLEANPDVKAAGIDGLGHWCSNGKTEGRASCFQDSQCAPKTCVGGSTDVQSSANNVGAKTTCSFSWNTAAIGQPAAITRATNGGGISATCSASGEWANIISSCPQPADAGCTNGATNYPSCDNRSCNAGQLAGGLLCNKICKGINLGQRIINGYLINTIQTGTHTNQSNITTNVAGTHFHPYANYYGFNCSNGNVSYDGVNGNCEYHVDVTGVDAECDTAINNPYVDPCADGSCGGR